MTKYRSLVALTLITAGLGLIGVDTAWAQEAADGAAPPGEATSGGISMALKFLGATIGVAMVVTGGAWSIGRIGVSAVESMARQPEASGSINFATIVTAAMIEGATLFGVVVCLLAVIL